MLCPECKRQNKEDARYCKFCGTDLKYYDAGSGGTRLKGNMAGKSKRDLTMNGSDGPRYCKVCGRQLIYGSCPTCGASVSPQRSKRWIGIASAAIVILLTVVISFAALHKNKDEVHNGSEPVGQNSVSLSQIPAFDYNEPLIEDSAPLLSGACDYILCSGTDNAGNTYELVANQTESALGYEITVGVIKNNSWLYPLSNDFPFLAEDGLFHVSAPQGKKSGTSLQQANSVIKNIYFVDSGAFLMECYKSNNSLSLYDHMYIIFSCDSLESCTLDCNKTTLMFLREEPSFSAGYVISYGRIYTENGKLVAYSETSGTRSGWLEDQVFEWNLFDVQTLQTSVIATNVSGVRPEGVLSEGLIFATDKCFYNTNFQKVIDLTEYNIDISGIYFKGGTCTFKAKNGVGTTFLVTIDSSGKVLSEVSEN